MRDKVRFQYAEAQVLINCIVCNKQFMAFPDAENQFFSCPKCQRMFEFSYSIRPLNDNQIEKLSVRYKSRLIR